MPKVCAVLLAWPSACTSLQSLAAALPGSLVALPAAVLLIQASERWRAEHEKPPSTSKERSAFKELIASMKRSVEGVPLQVVCVCGGGGRR